MKVTSINDYIKRHPNSHSMFRGEGRSAERLYESALPKSNQDNSVCVNNNVQNKSVTKTADLKSSGFFSAKNPSFGCAPVVKAPEQMGKFADWIVKTPIAHKFLKLAGKNPAVFEATAALVVAGALRPATIMALPASKADKEKNKKAASHSISSGLIGLASSILLFQPVTAALKKIDEIEEEKYLLDRKQKSRKQFQKIIEDYSKIAFTQKN